MCNKVALDHPYATRPPYYSNLVARSFENRSWLIMADWIWPNDGVSVCPGNSVIYDLNSLEVARSLESDEQMIMLDIPLDRLLHVKGKRVHGSAMLDLELDKLKLV